MTDTPPQFNYRYTGKVQPAAEGERDTLGRIYHPYLPSDALIEAVNLAIDLNRPLLLEGEPGCGKTRLAGAVAYELTQKNLAQNLAGQTDGKDNSGKDKPLWWPYYIWNVKSSSRARDGLYTFDAVARLRDAQLVGSNLEQLQGFLDSLETKHLKERLKDRKEYRSFGPLGEAICQEQRGEVLPEKGYRPIVLIDEIDKGDRDFTNDLLLELDELRFEIPETGEDIPTPECKPIVLMTSNREKPLPEAFLRRCLYFYVPFPKREELLNILQVRFGADVKSDAIVKAALDRFEEIRGLLDNSPGSRSPGTSEFLEFLTALRYKNPEDALSDLENLAQRLPLLGTLLKTQSDQELYRQKFNLQNVSGKQDG